jgi:hypothetical protein
MTTLDLRDHFSAQVFDQTDDQEQENAAQKHQNSICENLH